MKRIKFEWELRVTWFFPKSDETLTEVVGRFVAQYDAVVCMKALQSICKNKEYSVHKIGGTK